MSESEFIEFVDSNQGIIHKICKVYTNNPSDYEDLFQEIMLQLWVSIHSYKGEAKLTTWMYKVALFTALTRLKKEKKIQFVEEREAHHVVTEDDLQLDEDELLRAIKQLKDADKALIFLYLEEKTYAEMAEIMGLTESNIGVRINRIKSRIKVIMEKEQ